MWRNVRNSTYCELREAFEHTSAAGLNDAYEIVTFEGGRHRKLVES
jgi:hypothetical protein